MLSPLFLFNIWQGDSVPWDGMAMDTSGSQRAAHLLSVQFDAMCTHRVPLICRVRTHCADNGNVRRDSPWPFPSLLELFEISFMQEIWEGVGGCYIDQDLGNGRLDHLSSISCSHKAGL